MFDEVDISKYMEGIKKWCKSPEKQMEYERNIRKAISQNKKDDEFLQTSNFVSSDLWSKFIDAINYDNATSVNWATHKLAILYRRTQSGEKIFVPKLNATLEASNFEDIICQQFSKFIYNQILKN